MKVHSIGRIRPAVLRGNAGLLLLVALMARADTAHLQQEHILDAALIAAKYPRESWAPNDPGYWHMPYRLRDHDSVFLIRFDLSSVPADHRILAAQLGVYVQARNSYVMSQHLPTKVGLWRMLVPWGPGVCWEHRGEPDEPPWGKPGGTQPGLDRAQEPTDIQLLRSQNTWLKFNVRADVEAILGGEANHGWAIQNIESAGGGFEIVLPISGDPKLRPTLTITHQPK